jgi:Rrf2 family protein
MKFSRTAVYAIHAMAHIAEQDETQPVIGRKMAQRLDVPQGFLVRLLGTLARSELLRSIKGPNGGYNLGRPAKVITLLDIIEAAEGPIMGWADPISSPPDALDDKLQEVISAAAHGVRNALGRVTLVNLLGKRAARASRRPWQGNRVRVGGDRS